MMGRGFRRAYPETSCTFSNTPRDLPAGLIGRAFHVWERRTLSLRRGELLTHLATLIEELGRYTGKPVLVPDWVVVTIVTATQSTMEVSRWRTHQFQTQIQTISRRITMTKEQREALVQALNIVDYADWRWMTNDNGIEIYRQRENKTVQVSDSEAMIRLNTALAHSRTRLALVTLDIQHWEDNIKEAEAILRSLQE